MEGTKVLNKVLQPVVYFTGVTSEEGAKNQLWCATAPLGPKGVEPGKFYVPFGKYSRAKRRANADSFLRLKQRSTI
jgi:hypothetical protein